MNNVVKNNLPQIIDVCKKYQVKSLYLFGSAATDNFKKNSDVDFLIEYSRDAEGLPLQPFDYFDVLFELENITRTKVDLLVKEAMRNAYFIQSVEKQKILIYES